MANKRFIKYIIVLIFSLILTGCGVSGKFFDEVDRPSGAVVFYEQLDTLVDQEDVENAYGSKICGFPYLRSNRFFTYLKDKVNTDAEKMSWVKYLQKLDLEARSSEINNLSKPSIEKLQTFFKIDGDRKQIVEKLRSYSNRMLEKDLKNPYFIRTLIEKVETPDDYSTAMRLFGGYPFAYGPVAYFSNKVFEKMKAITKKPVDKLKIHGKLLNYGPSKSKYDAKIVKGIFIKSKKDPLGLLQISIEDKITLVHSFAPSYEQDFVASYDKIGEVIWKDGTLSVDSEKPVVYYYFSNILYKEKPVIQINYVIWYSRRDGPIAWYEKGVMDGFNFRITLDQTGTPVLVDVVHQCGCFHFFIPNKNMVKKIKKQSFQFDALVLAYLPQSFPQKRISLRIGNGGHLIENIGVERETKKITYNFLPYNKLLSLPMGNKRKSMFGIDGIGVGTQRAEPYFLFPMGVREIGAMRQRSHHPTKLVGKAHFDDPMFLNNSFEFK
jgi:hypothetical protein